MSAEGLKSLRLISVIQSVTHDVAEELDGPQRSSSSQIHNPEDSIHLSSLLLFVELPSCILLVPGKACGSYMLGGLHRLNAL